MLIIIITNRFYLRLEHWIPDNQFKGELSIAARSSRRRTAYLLFALGVFIGCIGTVISIHDFFDDPTQ